MSTHILNEAKRRFEPKNTVCIFCNKGAHSASMKENCFIPIYKVKDRTNVVVYRNVKYNSVKVGLPRCERCRKVHFKAKAINNIVLYGSTALVFIIPSIFAVIYDESLIWFLKMAAIAFCINIVLFLTTHYMVAFYILKKNEVTSETDGAEKEPLIIEFLKDGWTFDKPSA